MWRNGVKGVPVSIWAKSNQSWVMVFKIPPEEISNKRIYLGSVCWNWAKSKQNYVTQGCVQNTVRVNSKNGNIFILFGSDLNACRVNHVEEVKYSSNDRWRSTHHFVGCQCLLGGTHNRRLPSMYCILRTTSFSNVDQQSQIRTVSRLHTRQLRKHYILFGYCIADLKKRKPSD